MSVKRSWLATIVALAAAVLVTNTLDRALIAQGPSVVDPDLQVRTVFDGLVTPIGMAFLDSENFLVLEKNTGKVIRISSAAPSTTVLDLAVNSASERGLLSIALHPNFPTNPGVYLFWTESSTGSDTSSTANTVLLGNRLDRFVWNGTTLTFDHNVLRFRALQQDEGQSHFGNHNGGVIRFGLDEKLYVLIGDVGRRGQLQNLPDGPFGPGQDDDQYGGPEPDDAHLAGVILRINTDGSAPSDNPFFTVGGNIGGQAGANIQRIYSYGHRNGFGMAFDRVSNVLWMQENGDDSFSELNRVLPGMNGGWIQIAGPVNKVAKYRSIETTIGGGGLQQIRWPPTNIAQSSSTALSRLFMLDGSHYADPAFSWKYEIAPGGMGFHRFNVLGKKYKHDLFVGAATGAMAGGYLFKFEFNDLRTRVKVTDPRIKDRLANNTAKHDITESESLLFGSNFGTVTDILTGPSGNLFLVSLSKGSIFEIYKP